jgi:hypothetical protein
VRVFSGKINSFIHKKLSVRPRQGSRSKGGELVRHYQLVRCGAPSRIFGNHGNPLLVALHADPGTIYKDFGWSGQGSTKDGRSLLHPAKQYDCWEDEE